MFGMKKDKCPKKNAFFQEDMQHKANYEKVNFVNSIANRRRH